MEKKIELPKKDIDLYIDSLHALLSKGVQGKVNAVLTWKIGDNIIYNANLFRINGFYIDTYGYKPERSGKISSIVGVGHDSISESFGDCLGIEDKIFIPSQHTTFCSSLVKPLVKELTDPTERGGWLVRYEKLMEFWVNMCKSSTDPVRFKKIIQELELYANREFEPIHNIRNKK